jgi:hypothetical protein
MWLINVSGRYADRTLDRNSFFMLVGGLAVSQDDKCQQVGRQY